MKKPLQPNLVRCSLDSLQENAEPGVAGFNLILAILHLIGQLSASGVPLRA
jgi:hypothetical protein